MNLKNFLLLMFLFSFLAILALPFSPTGAKWGVSVVNDLTPLDIEYGGGSLPDNLQLRRMRILMDNVDLQLFDLKLAIVPRCLLLSKICVSELEVGRLDVAVLPENGVADDDKPADDSLFEFPVMVSGEHVSVLQTRIHWESGEWTSGPIQGAINIVGNELLVKEFTAQQSQLLLATSSQPFEERSPRIELAKLYIPFDLVIDNLVLEHPQWALDDARHAHRRIELSGHWQRSSLQLEHGFIASEGWGGISLAGQLDFNADWPLNARADIVIEEPPVWAGLHGRNLQLEVSGNLGELDVLAVLDGPQRHQLTAHIDALDKYTSFEFALDANWNDTLLLQDIPGVDLAGPELQLLPPLRLKATGNVQRQDFTLAGAVSGLGYERVVLDVAGAHEDSTLDFEAITLVDAATDSEMQLAGTLALAKTLRWDVEVQSGGLQLPALDERFSGRMQGRFASTGEAEGESWRLAVTDMALDGTVNKQSARLSGQFSLDKALLLGDSEFTLMLNRSELSVSAIAGGVPELSLKVYDLGDWIEESRGSIAINASLQDSQRQVVFSGSASSLLWQGLAIDSGRVEGNLNLLGSHEFTLSAVLRELRYGAQKLNIIELSGSGTLASQQITLHTEGDVATTLLVNGNIGKDGIWRGELGPTAIATGGGDWRLHTPVALSLDEQLSVFSIAAHCWEQLDARICPGQLALGAEGKASVTLQGDLRYFDNLTPGNMALEGPLEASGKARWGGSDGMTASAKARMGSGRLSRLTVDDEPARVNWDKISVDVQYTADGLAIESDIWREAARQFHFELVLPTGRQQQMRGALVFSDFQLAGVLKPFFPIISSQEGDLNGELLLSGSFEKPLLDGELQLTDGAAYLVGNPTTFQDLDLRILGEGNTTRLEGQALLGGGPTQLSGQWVFYPDPRLELNIVGQEQSFLLPPGIEAIVSENLSLVFLDSHLELSGDITVHEALLEHEQLPAGSVGLSSDVVEVDYRGKVLKSPGPIDFSADVRVRILDSLKVVGTGLQARVGGELDLRKAPTLPLQLFGELNILEGRIDAFGQDLKIRQGNLSFVGPPDNPDLNVRAERNIRDESIMVGIQVLGKLDAFSFSLYSSPTLTEPEMMSYLIRGRGIDKGAESDGAAVALSLGMGAMNQTGVVEGINRIPGIRDVSFGTDGNANETTATLGGYVGERLYFSYGVGVYEPINVLTSRFYFQSRFWLEVVSSLKSSADLYYSFDIQ